MKMSQRSEPIPIATNPIDNLGELISPLIFSHIARCESRAVAIGAAEWHVSAIGSTLGAENRFAVVWGTGIIRSSDRPPPQAVYLAVRGPLTRDAVIRVGGECPEVYGDPAVLLPQVMPVPEQPRNGIGIILHWREKPKFASAVRNSGLKLIDIQGDATKIVREICACESTLSSSLHGIIVSHAYGIPSGWLKVSDLPLGDDTKFADYLLSVEMSPSPIHKGLHELANAALHTSLPKSFNPQSLAIALRSAEWP